MIKFVTILFTALLMTSASFSQDGFPKVLQPGDRVQVQIWGFTLDQGDSLIRLFVWNDQLRVSDSVLHSQLDSAKVALKQFHISDDAQKEQLKIANNRIDERDKVISAKDDLEKHQKKKIRNLRIGNKILGVSTGVFGIAAVILLLLL